MKKIRKKYILIIFALFPISIDAITKTHQMVNDENNLLIFYHVIPQKKREKKEKELALKHEMIEKRAGQLKNKKNRVSHSLSSSNVFP